MVLLLPIENNYLVILLEIVLSGFLNILLFWIRDVFLIQSAIDMENIVNIDRIADLRKFTQKYSLEKLIDIERDIVKAYQVLAENLNIKLPLLMLKEKITYG